MSITFCNLLPYQNIKLKIPNTIITKGLLLNPYSPHLKVSSLPLFFFSREHNRGIHSNIT